MGEGIKKYTLAVISHRDVIRSMRNTVNDLMTMHSDRCFLDLLGWSLHKVYKCRIAVYTP